MANGKWCPPSPPPQAGHQSKITCFSRLGLPVSWFKPIKLWPTSPFLSTQVHEEKMCQLSYHKSNPIPISLCFLVAMFIWLFLPHLVPGCPRRLVAKGPEAKLQQVFQLQHGFLHTDEVSHLGDGGWIGLIWIDGYPLVNIQKAVENPMENPHILMF